MSFSRILSAFYISEVLFKLNANECFKYSKMFHSEVVCVFSVQISKRMDAKNIVFFYSLTQ